MGGNLGVLCIRLLSKKRDAHIVLTEQGIWIPERRRSQMEDVPDLMGVMLGSAIDSRRRGEDVATDVDICSLVTECEDPHEIERRLMPHAIHIPYSAIIRCYLARPGRFSRSKFAFDSFDKRLGKVVSKEFRICADDVEDLERMLSSVISDRLEVH